MKCAWDRMESPFSFPPRGRHSRRHPTGQPIVARFAVKPTSSILRLAARSDAQGHETDILTKGRHDPCVEIRAVPVGVGNDGLVLADHFLRHGIGTAGGKFPPQ